MKITISELAKKYKVAKSTLRARIKRLEKNYPNEKILDKSGNTFFLTDFGFTLLEENLKNDPIAKKETLTPPQDSQSKPANNAATPEQPAGISGNAANPLIIDLYEKQIELLNNQISEYQSQIKEYKETLAAKDKMINDLLEHSKADRVMLQQALLNQSHTLTLLNGTEPAPEQPSQPSDVETVKTKKSGKKKNKKKRKR